MSEIEKQYKGLIQYNQTVKNKKKYKKNIKKI